jgi:guanosine-3',5'-bis(diphosphate) 3'-pyrophosphohydrolase
MKEKENMLKAVEEFATKAHGEQKRKYTPEPYIVHPIRVMHICRQVTDDPCILSSALLHDVLEDTPVTKKEILDFLLTVMNQSQAQRTLELVVELTDVYVKENYPRLNRRRRKALEQERMEKTSADSQTVKYADILDNCREIVLHDPDFAKVFLRECLQLLERMKKGNAALYEQAKTLVENNLVSLKSPQKNEQPHGT